MAMRAGNRKRAAELRYQESVKRGDSGKLAEPAEDEGIQDHDGAVSIHIQVGSRTKDESSRDTRRADITIHIRF